MSIDRNTAVIGGWNTEWTSRVDVFERGSGGWAEVHPLIAEGVMVGDQFGIDVALHGDTVLVGSNWTDQQTGAAYAFRRTSSSWQQDQVLVMPNPAQGAHYGSFLDVNGDAAVVSAVSEDRGQGAIYMYDLPARAEQLLK